MLRFILILTIMILANAETSEGQQTFNVQHYTAENGFPQKFVSHITEDSLGYLWISTIGGGIMQYDGKRFVNYTINEGLIDNFVIAGAVDRNQNLWFATSKGVSKFNGQTFLNFPLPDSIPGPIKNLAISGDTTLFITSTGLGKIIGDRLYGWDIKLHNLRVKGLFSTDRELIYHLDNQALLIQDSMGLRRVILDAKIKSITNVIRLKNELMLSTELGVYLIEKDLVKFKLGLVEMVAAKIEGDLLQAIGYQNNALMQVTFRENQINRTDVLTEPLKVYCGFVDKEENIWLGSYGFGLYKLRFQRMTKVENRNHMVTSVLKTSPNKLVIGTAGNGLITYSNNFPTKNILLNQIEKAERQGPDLKNVVITLTQDSLKDLWVGTYGGLGHLNQDFAIKKWFTEADGLPGNSIRDVELTDSSGIWIATRDKGIAYFDRQSFKTYNKTNGLITDFIRDLKFDSIYNRLLIGTEKGFQSFDGKSFKTIGHLVFTNNEINSINFFNDSVLLVGTGKDGVYMVSRKTFHHTTLLTRDKGLSSNLIYFVASESDGTIWVGTDNGIDRVKLNDKFEIDEIENFGYFEGLYGIETNLNAFDLASETPYFGLIDGLYQFNPATHHPEQAFPIHLTRVLTSGKVVQSRAELTSGALVVPYQENAIGFEFNLISKNRSRKVQYSYWLKGVDYSWSTPSFESFTKYTNLPPGKYEFQAIALTPYGKSFSQPLHFTFEIATPFYMTTIFKVAMIAFALILVYITWNLRLRSIIRRQVLHEKIRAEEYDIIRKEIARDFHDETGNKLTRMINYVVMLKREGNQSNHWLNKLEEVAKDLVSGTKDFIWTLDPKNDNLSDLFIHIKDFAEKYFREKGILFRAFTSGSIEGKLRHGESREIILIFKEAMTNVFKHSHARNVEFSLISEPDCYRFCLKDDGRGFEIPNGTNGLNNMKHRAQKIGCELLIQSSVNKGTQIEISLKL